MILSVFSRVFSCNPATCNIRDWKESNIMPSYDYNDYNEEAEDEVSPRNSWEIASWIVLAFTLLLNLAVIFILLIRQNAYSVVNKGN